MRKGKTLVSFQEAVRILRTGGVAALPTETVYGLAGSVYSEKALRRIFQLKKRPFSDPLIVHCLDVERAEALMSGRAFPARKLFRRFAPGPLTLVLPKSRRVSPLVTGGQETVALRIPSHPLMRRVLKATGFPLAAPSANMFGKSSPTSAEHVLSAFKGRVPVLDGGASSVGIESSIVRPEPGEKRLVILRPGAVTATDLRRFLKENGLPWTVVRAKTAAGSAEARKAGEKPREALATPGGFKRHYAPPAPLVIAEGGGTEKAIEARLKKLYPGRKVRFLRLPRSSYEAARRLYHDLRVLSGKNPAAVVICFQKKPSARDQTGCRPAVQDRLQKAASRRLRFPP